MLLEQIIMKCFLNMRAERSSAAIYHLITGKKSIQTIQDARLFKLENFYRVHRRLKKSIFKDVIKKLENQHLIETIHDINREDYYLITPKGEKWSAQNINYKIDYYRGSQYSHYDQLFLNRLYLSIQTFTNTARNHYNFIPIIDEKSCVNWVKQLYKSVKEKEKSYLENLHKELTPLLFQFEDKDAEIFVDRLTSYLHYGKSIDQLSMLYEIRPDDVVLTLNALTHKILEEVSENPLHYPILTYYIKNEIQELNLSKSAHLTYSLLKSNEPIERIAMRRQLKINTIHDHIVEIALNDETFIIEPYVSDNQRIKIKNAIKQLNSSKLKKIKEHVDEHISFFQIRLVISKYGNE